MTARTPFARTKSAPPAALLFVASIILLVVAVGRSAALAEEAAEPEEQAVLVGNLDVGLSGSGGIQRALHADRSGFGQAFTTGAESGGYSLSSVGIHVSQFFDDSNVADHLQVTIHAVATAGGPGQALCTLSNPSSFPAPGVIAFAAPTGDGACPPLAAGTSYFMVIEWLNPAATGRFAWIPQTYPTEESAATDEDPGGAAGWSIADRSYYLGVSSGIRTWTAFTNVSSFKIQVKGTALAPVEEVDENSPATGQPVIAGTAQVGETLTSDMSAIADEDGLDDVTFSYQWLRNDGTSDAEIAGATGASYTPVAGDEGKTITLRVSFTDDAGNEESLTSVATASVAAAEPTVNSPATGRPVITGTAQVGERLSVNLSEIADENGLPESFSYLWYSMGAEGERTRLSAALGSGVYRVRAADSGRTIVVQVNFIDGGGFSEQLVSEPTAAVEGAAPTELPHDLSAEATADAIVLSWTDAVGIARQDYYQILRQRPELGEASDLVYVAYAYSPTPSFTDTEVEPGVLYVYRVKAMLSLFGDLSQASLPVQIRMPSASDEADDVETEDDVDADADDPEEDASEPEQSNRRATGQPTIAGTAQVGEMLTADTSGITDEDGLDDVAFSYQWLADDTEIQGAAGVSYTPVAGDAGKTLTVRVAFTDDAGNGETLTSEPTALVALPALTVTPHDVPTAHDGETAFSFEIRFSEEPHAEFSYETLKLHAFSVTGGVVQKAQRLQKDPESNIPWRITVKPNSNADVTVVLPATANCNDAGAICTEDGRKLSHPLTITIPGPGG